MTLFKNPVVQAVAIVFGTIVGAGVLGVPFAIAQVGLLTGALILLVVGVALAFLMLFLGEVALQRNRPQQLTGYTAEFVGPKAKHVLAGALIINIYGALLAYVVGQGEVLSALFGGVPAIWSILFLVVGGVFIVLGINAIKYVETLLTALILSIFAAVIFLSAPEIDASNLLAGAPTFGGVLTAYGVALTACFGLTAVPQVRNILFTSTPHTLRRALLWGALLPPLLYVVFAAVVLGVTGEATTPVATIGLGEQLGGSVLILGSVFAIAAMATSFLALGLALRNVFYRDYNIPLAGASALTLGIPAVLFGFGLRDFILILSLVGVFALGLVCVMGVLTYWKARSREGEATARLVPHWLGTSAGLVMVLMFFVSMIIVVHDWLVE